MAQTILVVDDEKEYRDIINLFLTSEGFHVVEAANGRDAIRLFHETAPSLVVLDVLLPDMSGFEVCNTIRKSSNVLILFLSALGDEDYHIAGYRAGGDDYIAKPFRASVLAMKIRRMLERGAAQDQTVSRIGEIELDEKAYVCRISGRVVALTQKEFMVLSELMRQRGRVLTRNYLLQEIWGYDYMGESRAVDVLITKLRKKLGSSASLIKTVINVGYKMEDTP